MENEMEEKVKEIVERYRDDNRYCAWEAMKDLTELLTPPDSITTNNNVYGRPLRDVPVPSGWVWTGEYRRVKREERYLDTTGSLAVAGFDFLVESRMILRKVKRIVFEECGERVPQPNEFIINGGGHLIRVGFCTKAATVYRVTEGSEYLTPSK